MVAGSFFMLVAAIGIWKMPDVLMKMHALTKASSFGTVLLLLSLVPTFYHEIFNVIMMFLIIIFIFMTAPVSSQILSKSAHDLKTPLWKKTINDDLGEEYE